MAIAPACPGNLIPEGQTERNCHIFDQVVAQISGRRDLHAEPRVPCESDEHMVQEPLAGRDRHHVVEAAIKAVATALRDALTETDTVFSTKGAVRVDREEKD